MAPSTSIDRAAQRLQIALLLRDSLGPATTTAALALLVLAASSAVRATQGQIVLGYLPAAIGVGAASILFVAQRRTRRMLAPTRWAHALAMSLVLTMAGYIGLFLATSRDPVDALHFGLLIIGCGLLFLTWFWWGLSVLIGVAGWAGIIVLADVELRWASHAALIAICLLASAFTMKMRRVTLAYLLTSAAEQRHHSRETVRLSRALAERDRDYRELFRQSLDGIVIWEMVFDDRDRPVDAKYLEVNNHFESLTGLRPQDVIGRGIRQVLPDIEPFWLETFARVVTLGQPEHVEHEAGPLGRVYEAMAYPLDHPRFVTVFRDTTQRREDERRLRRTTSLLQGLVRSSPLAIVGIDAQGRVTLWNPAAEQMFGYAEAEVIGRPLPIVGPGDKASFLADLSRDLRDDALVQDRHVQRQRRDGTRIDLSVYSSPLRDEQGRSIGRIAMLADITQRKLAEQTLRQSEAHYREVARANRRLVSEVNHRVRNNLAGLAGLLAIMRRRHPEAAHITASTLHRVEAMIHVHDLLAQAKWSDMPLDRLVRQLVTTMERTAPRRVPIHINGPPVMIQPIQFAPLTMCLAELFTNSCKHGAHTSDHGRIDITWTLTPDGPEPATLAIRWRERGGPVIGPSPRHSLGMELIAGFVTHELHGRAELRFPAEGVDHELAFPVREAEPAAAIRAGALE